MAYGASHQGAPRMAHVQFTDVQDYPMEFLDSDSPGFSGKILDRCYC
jgi:hypothetical protein